MMDGSLGEDGKTPMDYDYNVEVTRKAVEMALACGVSVEGELGCIGMECRLLATDFKQLFKAAKHL